MVVGKGGGGSAGKTERKVVGKCIPGSLAGLRAPPGGRDTVPASSLYLHSGRIPWISLATYIIQK